MTDMLAVVMVGLPARGKSHVAHKLTRYLKWAGLRTRVFNVGDYRRARSGGGERHDFFSPDNEASKALRRELAMSALDDAIEWLQVQGGQIAIYDATNTTRRRRDLIVERCEREQVPLLFIEVIVNDADVIEANIQETKLRSGDFQGLSVEEAADEFRARIAHYERVYEPVVDEGLSFIKRIDGGRQIVVNRVRGELGLRIANFLSGMVSIPQPVWLTRHGESLFNVDGILGGDPRLSDRGRQYGIQLGDLVRKHTPELPGLQVWTSSLRRTIETALYLERDTRKWNELDEINAGTCEGMTYARVARELPDEYEARKQDKFRYRYPRGESYEEMIQRIDRVVVELERQTTPVLVVGHQAVLRVMYSYLMGTPREQCPHLHIPLHCLIQLTPEVSKVTEQRTTFDVDA